MNGAGDINAISEMLTNWVISRESDLRNSLVYSSSIWSSKTLLLSMHYVAMENCK